MTMSTTAAPTREEYAARTEYGRRLSRFRFARARVLKICAGEPRLTDEELAELAGILLAARTQDTAPAESEKEEAAA